MKKQKPTLHAGSARHSGQAKGAQPHEAQSPEQKQQRKDRVLTEGASSMVRDIELFRWLHALRSCSMKYFCPASGAGQANIN